MLRIQTLKPTRRRARLECKQIFPADNQLKQTLQLGVDILYADTSDNKYSQK